MSQNSVTSVSSSSSNFYHYCSSSPIFFSNPHKWLKECLQCQVSKNRIRLYAPKLKSSLDMSMIEPKIIAMGLPCVDSLGKLYRNDVTQVEKFLNTNFSHPGYLIVNLTYQGDTQTSEYHQKYFQDSNCAILNISTPDHHPFSFDQIYENLVDPKKSMMIKYPNFNLAVHCKAGKGRTGTFITCVLLLLNKINHSNYTLPQILRYLGQKRCENQICVTICSQKRFLKYFDLYLDQFYMNSQFHELYARQHFKFLRLKIKGNRHKLCQIFKMSSEKIYVLVSQVPYEFVSDRAGIEKFSISRVCNFATPKSIRNNVHVTFLADPSKNPLFSITFDPFFHFLKPEKFEISDLDPSCLKEHDLDVVEKMQPLYQNDLNVQSSNLEKSSQLVNLVDEKLVIFQQRDCDRIKHLSDTNLFQINLHVQCVPL